MQLKVTTDVDEKASASLERGTLTPTRIEKFSKQFEYRIFSGLAKLYSFHASISVFHVHGT